MEAGNFQQLKHDGLCTLGEIIDMIPDDIPLDEVIIRAHGTAYGYDSETTSVTFQRVVMVDDAEAKLAKYEEDIAEWERKLEDHKDAMVAWIHSIHEEEKAGIPEKRKRLAELQTERKRLEEDLREAVKRTKGTL